MKTLEKSYLLRCGTSAAALLIAIGAAEYAAPGASISVAVAQEESEQKTRKTPAMREKVYTKLAEAQELAEAGSNSEAIKVLNNLRGQKDLNSYELAQLYNFYGFIYFGQENYKEAAKAYENVIAQPNLPEAMETQTLYSLSQLYFVQENYVKATEYLNRWFAVAINPGPEPYVLLGQSYYQQGKYKEAIVPVNKAIALANEAGKPVKENWLLLLRTFYYELNDYKNMEDILERLIRMYPKKEYWIQLSGVYGERGEDRKQLIAYELAHLQGFLTSGRELITLGQLYLQANVPFKAAKVLQEGIDSGLIDKDMKNYRLLSQAWMMAGEDLKAIPALVEAARRSGDGELDSRLAQSYLNIDRYEEAVAAARTAISKGGLRRPDSNNVVLGLALYNLERYEEAKQAFRAAQSDSRSSKLANQWLSHISAEQSREAQLRAALRGR